MQPQESLISCRLSFPELFRPFQHTNITHTHTHVCFECLTRRTRSTTVWNRYETVFHVFYDTKPDKLRNLLAKFPFRSYILNKMRSAHKRSVCFFFLKWLCLPLPQPYTD